MALSLIYAAGHIALREPLLGFYRLGEEIQGKASTYLAIICLGMVFFDPKPSFTGKFNGAGDSTSP